MRKVHVLNNTSVMCSQSTFTFCILVTSCKRWWRHIRDSWQLLANSHNLMKRRQREVINFSFKHHCFILEVQTHGKPLHHGNCPVFQEEIVWSNPIDPSCHFPLYFLSTLKISLFCYHPLDFQITLVTTGKYSATTSCSLLYGRYN